MQSSKDLKKRIASVKNTQQTTKAMKVVSAAKLRRAQDAIIQYRPYANGLMGLTRKVAAQVSTEKFATIKSQEELALIKNRKCILVAVTLDRGLCAGFNVNVIKAVEAFVREHKSIYQDIEIAVIGKKGYEYFRRLKTPHLTYFPQFSGKAVLSKAQDLSNLLMKSYLSKSVTEVKIVYNEFVNALTQKVRVERFLPIEPLNQNELEQQQWDSKTMLVEPEAKDVMRSLMNKNFQMQIFRILLESQAGEHGARMTAMDNATKNADEMIDRLSLEFNKQRQANITKELLEIISGSESQQ